MSRTTKRLQYNLSRKWTGHKQNKRDKLRTKIINRQDYHRYGDRHANYWHIARVLFSRGYSLEEVRKRLVGKHRCSSHDANDIINELGPMRFGVNYLKLSIEGIVCVKNSYAVSAATANLDPHFLIQLDLPIYYWHEDEYRWQSNHWGGGNVVFMNNKIYKFAPEDLLDSRRCSTYKEGGDYQRSKLSLWPNEKVSAMAEEVVEIHMDSGMENCKFRIHGWKNLRYTIETAKK